MVGTEVSLAWFADEIFKRFSDNLVGFATIVQLHFDFTVGNQSAEHFVIISTCRFEVGIQSDSFKLGYII